MFVIEAATEINGMVLMNVEMTGVEKTGVEMTVGIFGWCWYCQIQTAAVGKETAADKNALV